MAGCFDWKVFVNFLQDKQLAKSFGSNCPAIWVSSTVVLLLIDLLSLSLQHNYNIMCGFRMNACLPLHPVQLGVEETGSGSGPSELVGLAHTYGKQIILRSLPMWQAKEELWEARCKYYIACCCRIMCIMYCVTSKINDFYAFYVIYLDRYVV